MSKPIATVCCLLFLCMCRANAADDSRAKAIEKGASYLRKLHQPALSYQGGSYKVGSASLAGWALLECGIPADDAAIANMTAFIRANAFRQASTYEMALMIMYLDRLGDQIDQPTIQFLAIKLLAGQSPQGGWAYSCGFELDEAQATRLRSAIYSDSQLRNPQPKNQANPPANAKDRPTNPQLHPEVVRHARAIESAIAANKNLAASASGDHSNTQFALIALWIARKHGVACGNALAVSEKRFRAVQTAEGGWSYICGSDGSIVTSATPGAESTPAMTCAGLIAIATGRGSRLSALSIKSGAPPLGGDAADPRFDRATALAFKYLERSIARNERAKDAPMEAGKLFDNLYFLWSLERVAMIYDLEKIGALDWYEWGASHLIKTQDKDGGWSQTGYDGANAEINTAFALLFLNRANLARDLTATLKGKATVKLNLPDRVPNPEPSKVDPKHKSDPPLTNLSEAEFAAEANRLCESLVNADASSRASILTLLRDSKGSVYTEGLVRAIGKLKGEQQRTAREALALRLKRMTAPTLRDMLKDANAEIRCAAAVACGLKGDKQHIPDLTAALRDTEEIVVQAARNSLRMLE